eukprot:TRINITY_DN1386_c0_g1_i2.p1 TRINITY_DN1386_c0_g1~~TRINITY_DN1386_c0_g1_i2.p1  ORF type:complete len:180 (-),score=14.84 TRINITY_DN1386_c0_g1_i2:637-1176(-)
MSRAFSVGGRPPSMHVLNGVNFVSRSGCKPVQLLSCQLVASTELRLSFQKSPGHWGVRQGSSQLLLAAERGPLQQTLLHASRGRLDRSRKCFALPEDDKVTSSSTQQPITAILENLKSGTFWVQLIVAILTLGFIDAGYSGDWSRIGFLTKEQEGLLQTTALFLVPLSGFVIWQIGKAK